MKRTNIYLLEKHIIKLKQIRKTTGAPSSEIIRRALDKYFKEQDVNGNEKEINNKTSKKPIK